MTHRPTMLVKYGTQADTDVGHRMIKNVARIMCPDWSSDLYAECLWLTASPHIIGANIVSHHCWPLCHRLYYHLCNGVIQLSTSRLSSSSIRDSK